MMFTEEEITKLRRILFWVKAQEQNRAIKIDADEMLKIIKQKENPNGPITNSPGISS